MLAERKPVSGVMDVIEALDVVGWGLKCVSGLYLYDVHLCIDKTMICPYREDDLLQQVVVNCNLEYQNTKLINANSPCTILKIKPKR